MTQAQTRASGLVTPSLPQLWLTAMLRMLVELVLNVVSTFQMRFFGSTRDWHTRKADAALPERTNDTQQREISIWDRRAPARQSTHSVDDPSALMVSSTQSVRPSNHEGMLKTHATRAGLFQRQFQEFQLCFQQDFQRNFQLAVRCPTLRVARLRRSAPA